MKTTLFSSHDMRRIVRRVGLDALMDETIAAIAAACRNFDPGVYAVPCRAGFAYDGPPPGLLEWMPAMKFGDKITVKMVGYHPQNPDRSGLPTILSTVLIFDTRTGHLAGVADGTFMTSIRTGASSAVASEILAAPDSEVLGLIGAGAQAITQLHALSRRFSFDTVLIHDTDPQALATFADRAALIDIGRARIATAPIARIVAESQVLCTATSIGVRQGPLFDDAALAPGAHINAVGSDFPGKTELPLSLLQRSLVCPDFKEQALQEGECQQLEPEQTGPDLATLVRNAADFEQYRGAPTVFDSTGWALEDYVATEILTRHGADLGCGTEIDLESISSDPRDPYGFLDGVARRLNQAASGNG